MSTPDRFAGTRVIVTGGARGIGGRIAERFGQEGAHVAILDRMADAGRAHAECIGARFIETDLADNDDARRAMREAIDRLSGVDVLVNNAGMLRFASVLETDPDEWDAMFAVNTRAMLVTTQVAATAMIEAGASRLGLSSSAKILEEL